MKGDGEWLQRMQTGDIADQGSPVTLPNGKAAPALFISDPKEYQKYVPEDGALLGRGKINGLFVFSGDMEGKINEADTLTFRGTEYTVNPPTHPQYNQGVCIALAVFAYIA